MTENEEYYAALRQVAATLRSAANDARAILSDQMRDETPDWLLERIDGICRTIESAAGDVGRFIREDRAGTIGAAPTGYGEEDPLIDL